MYLEKISINKFRNLKKVELNFNKEKTFFFGDNAQGKSNILEAIYILCLAKSFRTRNDGELIPFGEDHFSIDGKFIDELGIARRVAIQYLPIKGKKIHVDGKNLAQFSKLIGLFPIVTLSSIDHSITDGPPSQRRRFFNIMLSQSSSLYMNNLKEYERILKQRNIILSKILKKEKESKNELDIWNSQLIKRGEFLMKARYDVVNDINQKVTNYYKTISKSSESLRVVYAPNVSFDNKDMIINNFEQAFKRNFHKEKLQGTTLVGPHRDEFILLIGDKNLKVYGSRGEHKSALVSMKIAELDFLRIKTETEPILLLDDLYAELDKERGQNVLDLFSADCQAFITGTSFDFSALKNLQTGSHENVFMVESGKVNKV